MARPPKYDREAIKRDYEAGTPKKKIREKFNVPRNTLDNWIRDEKWVINEHADKAMSHLRAVSGEMGQIAQECPKILPNVIDRIKEETPFNMLMEETMMLGLEVQKKIFKNENVTTQAVAMGEVVDLTRDLTPKDINDGMSAIYKAKEIKFGKEFPQKDEGGDEPEPPKKVEIVRRTAD